MELQDRRTARILLTILVFALVLTVLYVARSVIIIFAFSALFACLINPVVRFLQRSSLFFRNLKGPHVPLADNPIAGVNASLSVITKGGLHTVTRQLAIEYEKEGIRFNAVASGAVDRPYTRMISRIFFGTCSPWEGSARHKIWSTPLFAWQKQIKEPERGCMWTVAFTRPLAALGTKWTVTAHRA